MDEAIEEKANKKTKTPSETKDYSLKSDAGIWYSITAHCRQFYFLFFYNSRRNGNILQTDNKGKDLRSLDA